MKGYYRTSGAQSPTTWQDQAAEIKQAVKDRDRLVSIMTVYEKLIVSEYIGGLKEKYKPTIEAGALELWNGARSSLQAAIKNVEREKRKVTNSWDASKLAAEMQVMQMRVDQAVKADAGRPDLPALQRISLESQESGDRYKVRARAEIFQSIVSKIPPGNQDKHGNDARVVANRMAECASRDLATLRTSPELTQAEELKAAKIDELTQARRELFRTAEVLGEVNPNDTMRNSAFIDALATVQQDSDGNFIFTEKE
jgi:hypothetical protein